MSASAFIVWNADTSALTAPFAGAATASTVAVKTMLQLKVGPTGKIRILEWGYEIATIPTAPLQFELVETGTVFGTVTTIGSGILPYNDIGATSLAVTGTSATGFTASAEGTITATRLLDDNIDQATYFVKQFPLGREPEVGAGKCLRIRATPGTTASSTVKCHIVWEE